MVASLNIPQGSTAWYILNTVSQQYDIYVTNISASWNNSGGTTTATVLRVGGYMNYCEFIIPTGQNTISLSFGDNPMLTNREIGVSLSSAIGATDFVIVNVSYFYVLK